MHWTYDEVLALDADVYAVLVEELDREAAELKVLRDRARGGATGSWASSSSVN